jgi:hypothetical protein
MLWTICGPCIPLLLDLFLLNQTLVMYSKTVKLLGLVFDSYYSLSSFLTAANSSALATVSILWLLVTPNNVQNPNSRNYQGPFPIASAKELNDRLPAKIVFSTEDFNLGYLYERVSIDQIQKPAYIKLDRL